MGREAIVHAEVGAQADEARALLESGEIILRGAIRRRFPRSALEQVRVENQALCFTCAGETVSLHLGADIAEAWDLAISTPPPNLRAKLGLHEGALALQVGAFGDVELAQALDGVLARDDSSAQMIVACVQTAADLDSALLVHAQRPGLPLWVIYPKGHAVEFGGSAVRATLRTAGFRETKACAVSDHLTATRYHPI